MESWWTRGGGTEGHFQRGRERERVQAVSESDGTAGDTNMAKQQRAESN